MAHTTVSVLSHGTDCKVSYILRAERECVLSRALDPGDCQPVFLSSYSLLSWSSPCVCAYVLVFLSFFIFLLLAYLPFETVSLCCLHCLESLGKKDPPASASVGAGIIRAHNAPTHCGPRSSEFNVTLYTYTMSHCVSKVTSVVLSQRFRGVEYMQTVMCLF